MSVLIRENQLQSHDQTVLKSLMTSANAVGSAGDTFAISAPGNRHLESRRFPEHVDQDRFRNGTKHFSLARSPPFSGTGHQKRLKSERMVIRFFSRPSYFHVEDGKNIGLFVPRRRVVWGARRGVLSFFLVSDSPRQKLDKFRQVKDSLTRTRVEGQASPVSTSD